MTENNLGSILSHRMSGEEPLTNSSKTTNLNLLEFWQWSASDLVSNALRGALAEYIVASAVGCHCGVRAEWDPYDIKTAGGIKIEVKSAAYLQSWSQKKLSKIQFSVRAAYGWDSEFSAFSKLKIRHADIYVFCVLAHKDKLTVDPLNLDQWEFYCITTQCINSKLGNQKTVSLSRLLSLSPLKVNYGGLETTIQALADRLSKSNI